MKVLYRHTHICYVADGARTYAKKSKRKGALLAVGPGITSRAVFM